MKTTQQVNYSMSSGLAARLAAHGISLAFTSYQSGLVYLLGHEPNGALHVHQSVIERPMGLWSKGKYSLLLATGHQIFRFENILETDQRVNAMFDVCFVPRTAHFTGSLDVHDIGQGSDGHPVFVSSRFNCLATLDARHSFKSSWLPPFISQLIDEDRCHLNGMAMDDGRPAFVTAVSRSNTIDGWRDRRADGGVVIDVTHNKVVCQGLSMPHSPRLHDGILYVLNSGTGELGRVDFADGPDQMGRFVPIAFCPGFVRGLAFSDGFAFVGLSKPRYHRFEGLELDQRLADADSDPWCGVQVINLQTGACVDWFRIDGGVTELYDVAVVHGATTPMMVAPSAPEAAGFITKAG